MDATAKRTAAVWGLGHVGWSTVCHLAARGVEVFGVDPDARKVAQARAGVCPVGGAMARWITAAGVSPVPQVGAFTTAFDLVAARSVIPVHHVCVPTEKDGKPWRDALDQAVCAIYHHFGAHALIIVESTVSPDWLAGLRDTLPFLRLAAAPRRDWFDDPAKHLGVLARVVGADRVDDLNEAVNHLAVIGAPVIRAGSTDEAALTKVIENDLRFVELAYCQEVARLWSDRIDVRRVFDHAATKWNIARLHPSLGVGGPCIPLAGGYLAAAARQPEVSRAGVIALASYRAAITTFLGRFPRVDFLGIGYKDDAPYTPTSTATGLARDLIEAGVDVGVYPEDDDQQIAAAGLGAWVHAWGDIRDDDAVPGSALVIPIRSATTEKRIRDVASLARYSAILDGEDALGGVVPEGVDLRVPGRKGWLA